MWLTTADQAHLLERRHDVVLGAHGAPVTITVDDDLGLQRMEGFGASFTESATLLVHDRLEAGAREEVMRRLFDPESGIGLSLLRGGTLEPAAYEPYARYFVRFVEEDAARGVPVAAVTVQNEPHFSPATYPGMVLSAAQMPSSWAGTSGRRWPGAGSAPASLAPPITRAPCGRRRSEPPGAEGCHPVS